MIATEPRRPLAGYGLTDLDPMPPEDTTLLAFDPGGTTGWFMGTFGPHGEMDVSKVSWGQLRSQPHHKELGKLIEGAIRKYRHLMIVTEDYRPEFGRAQNYVALEYIGVMEYLARESLVPFERQDRGIKTFWTPANLRKVGLWPVGQVHAQDAARHWLAYATKHNESLKARILKKLR